MPYVPVGTKETKKEEKDIIYTAFYAKLYIFLILELRTRMHFRSCQDLLKIKFFLASIVCRSKFADFN